MMNIQVVGVLVCLIAAVSCCRFPPNLWCSSEEIARQCQVYEQCRSHFQRQRVGVAEKVQFELYYESLCPDCKGFIVQQFFPTYMKIGDIMNITLVPYGNARERKEGNHYVFDCQHGEDECLGNVIETCAIHELKTIERYFPFIHCIEASHSRPDAAAVGCGKQQGIPLQSIMACANSSLGNELEHKMAQKTDALQPQHKYVPWVVLNGVHTEKINDEATDNLLKLICDTYKGTPPAACNTKPSVCRA